nr:Do family serine endopeptidase [Sphingomonas jejuensis]
MTLQQPVGAQVAQNDPASMPAAAPRGAPQSFAELVARLQPAVVNISTRQQVEVPNNPFAGTPFGNLFGGRGGQGGTVTREATSLGSGFLISADGYIVTNSHVISPGARTATVESVTVTLSDRREFEARVVGNDTNSDIAVLKIDAGEALPFVRFGQTDNLRVGDWVLAIGNPFSLGGTVTAGIVSAIARVTGQGGAYDRYIQTDASINQGNSGGPMFDLNGNVVGINSAIISPSGGNVGIGFAIPADQAAPIVETLRRGERVRRGYLGVGIQPVTPEIAEALGLPRNRGEVIRSVEPGQPAARGGIQQGDVVVSVAGQEVTPDQTLSYIVSRLQIGQRIPVELIRDGRRQTVQVQIAERPPEEQLAQNQGVDEGFSEEGDGDTSAAARQSAGVAVQALTPQIARAVGVPPETRGVVVAAVDPSSDAAAKGLRRGFVILSVNRRPVATPEEFNAAVQASQQGSVLMLVQQGNNPPLYIGLRLRRN